MLQFPRGVADESGAEVRGLTAVPNPQAITGWPDKKMLLLATQMKLWLQWHLLQRFTRYDMGVSWEGAMNMTNRTHVKTNAELGAALDRGCAMHHPRRCAATFSG